MGARFALRHSSPHCGSASLSSRNPLPPGQLKPTGRRPATASVSFGDVEFWDAPR
jgi:hypothetical protein